MRLQLIVGLVALARLAGAQELSTGEGQATSRVLVYSDDDATTVITSVADAEVAVPGAQLGAHILLDSVSSASVDVVSAATERWSENRLELGARAQTELGGTNLRLAAIRSEENDWRSHSVIAGAGREFFQRNLQVSASYAFTDNTVGRAFDPNFARELRSHSLAVGLSQLLDDKTRAGVSYTLQSLRGFQSSPYRFVVAENGHAAAERHPERRQRHAISSYLLRSLARHLSARASYRLYRDDWGVWSHTGELRLTYALGSRFQGALFGRYYRQNQADFYRGRYDGSVRYMSRDRELASFWDAGAHTQLAVQVGPVSVDARVGAIHYRFQNFPLLPTRLVLLAGAGAQIAW